MIIVNIFKKIYISPFFYILGILSILTGLFKIFLIMYLIIIVHELGHIVMAIIFNYKISKINIYPFGGYTIFDVDINKSIISEFMVFFGGILFQFLLQLIFSTLIDHNSYIYRIFNIYNMSIIIFNLLPIIPLDGSKLLNIILNYIFSFKTSHMISIYTSYIFIIILIIFNYRNLNMITILIILLYILINEHKNHKFIFNKFLIERYIKDIHFNKNNFIIRNKIKKMKKYANNIFIINNNYIDEKEILRDKYVLKNTY